MIKAVKTTQKDALKAAAKAADKVEKVAGKVEVAATKASVSISKPAAKSAAKPAAPRRAATGLEALTVVQLRAKAKAAGVAGYSTMNKATLVASLSK